MTNDLTNPDNTLNQELQQLVNEANCYPANSDATHRAKRRIALTKLINAIQCSGISSTRRSHCVARVPRVVASGVEAAKP
ncbi:hypothetical protein IQ243_03035 [Nostocales cyanobacterium LEGE 11386]|nr:hypothetical protein [Nostocales cyanobacterium LEGE 11386]